MILPILLLIPSYYILGSLHNGYLRNDRQAWNLELACPKMPKTMWELGKIVVCMLYFHLQPPTADLLEGGYSIGQPYNRTSILFESALQYQRVLVICLKNRSHSILSIVVLLVRI